MNYPLVFKLLSVISAVVAVGFGLCFAVSIFYSANPFEAAASADWLASFILAFVVALIFFIPGRNASAKIFKREAMCVVGIGWTLSSLLGAIPFFLIMNSPFADAFFESVSGFTSSGSSVYGNVEEMPHSLLFWRSLMQWIGGLGVVIFFLVLLSSLGGGAKVLYSRESSLNYSELERGRLKSGIWRILRVYAVLSILCLASYIVCGMPIFDSVCHMLTTVSTGGFSVKNSGIGAYSSGAVEWVAIVFMFLGGINFALLLRAMHFDFKSLAKNSEFKAYLLIIALVSLMFFAMLADFKNTASASFAKSFTDSVFHVVSMVTSTGFSTTDYQLWPPFTHILIFMMLISGGCSGSTAGGMKIFRFVAVLKIMAKNIEKSFRPNVVRPVRMNGMVISEDGVRNILSFVVLYSVVAMAGIFLLALFEQNLSFGGCVTSVIASVSNIGIGIYETGPGHNFGFMTDMSKILLAFLMILGRLEFYAILVLFMPSLWKNLK